MLTPKHIFDLDLHIIIFIQRIQQLLGKGMLQEISDHVADISNIDQSIERYAITLCEATIVTDPSTLP